MVNFTKESIKDFNWITATDSYKQTHYHMYPNKTEYVYSYFESRLGARFPCTIFAGLQYKLMRYALGSVITQEDIEWAAYLAGMHFGNDKIFNRVGWEYIVNEYDGRLPLEIRAVAEGTPVPVGNVMMTFVNTDPKCWWLTNSVESFFTHVWAMSTSATLTWIIKNIQTKYLNFTSDNLETVLPFMLHDFGYRGSSSHESAQTVGIGHLINYLGTDTIPAVESAMKYYGGNDVFDKPFNIGFSVNASEHSIMTAKGEAGEFDLVDELLTKYPTGIISIVIDSYNWKRFIKTMGTPRFKERILNRDGKFVFRPDSGEPVQTSLEVYQAVANEFGYKKNSKGFEVLNPKTGCLWGDGVDEIDVENIYGNLMNNGVSAENYIIGMGGNIHQKINRDTQRNAFKSSYQVCDGIGIDIFKDPIDGSKRSKKGRLALINRGGGVFKTLEEVKTWHTTGDLLKPVFRNGQLLKEYSLDEMRKNALIV